MYICLGLRDILKRNPRGVMLSRDVQWSLYKTWYTTLYCEGYTFPVYCISLRKCRTQKRTTCHGNSNNCTHLYVRCASSKSLHCHDLLYTVCGRCIVVSRDIVCTVL